jgi:hypothetical protein
MAGHMLFIPAMRGSTKYKDHSPDWSRHKKIKILSQKIIKKEKGAEWFKW